MGKIGPENIGKPRISYDRDDRSSSSELNSSHSWNDVLQLYTTDNPPALDPATVTRLLPEIIQGLQEAGLNLKDIETTPELLESLNESQSRRMITGSGPALVVALDGLSVYKEILAVEVDSVTGDGDPNAVHRVFDIMKDKKIAALRSNLQIMADSAKMPHLEKDDDEEPDPWTNRRGYEQTAISLIRLAVTGNTDRFVREINWRVGAYFEKPITAQITKAKKEGRFQDATKLEELVAPIREKYGIPTPDSDNRAKYRGTSRIEPKDLMSIWKTLLLLGQIPGGKIMEYVALTPEQIVVGNDAKRIKAKNEKDIFRL